MNNMQKSFKKKSALRCMADGGIFKSMQRVGQDDIAVFTDAKNKVAGAQPYTPMAMRDLPNAGITSGGVTTPLPAKISPLPPMPEPAKLSVKPAAPVAPAAPAPVPAAPQQFRPQDPYEKMTGKPQIAIGPRSNLMAATGGFGPTTVPAPEPQRRPRAMGSIGANRANIGANRAEIGAMGMPIMTSVGYASGGEVKGPGGPTDDEVGPVMLSDGEYVLPADTVEKVGKENLDALKDATHTPVHVKQRRGLRKMADGTQTEREKRLGALGLPITTSVEYAEPVRPTPAVGALGLPITTSVGGANPIPRVGAMGLPITTSVGPDPMPRERTGALGLPITTSAGYGQPSAPQAPASAEGWQGKPRATPRLVEAPVPVQPPQITSPTMTAAWQAAQTAPAGESTAGAIGRNIRGFGAAALAPVESGLRYMGGSLSALGGGAKDLGAGLAGITPAAPATPAATTAVEKQAPAEVRGPDGKFPGDTAAPIVEPAGAVSPATPFTPLRSMRLESMGVSQGDQINPVYEMKQSVLPDAPQVGATVTPSAFASPGARQINSKYYQDANGAVIEGVAPVGAPASVAAGPKTLGDPNGTPTAWSDVPRTYRSDTIRAGTDPGAYTNFGEGIFGTSSKAGGPMDTFTGVGANYNSESARLGPDPGGVDRARQDAAVEAMFPDKPTPRGVRMPEFRTNERDINARFDKQLKAAEQRFTSPRAAGNLAKAQLQIEEARAAALNQDADNITRQQQSAMQFQSDQARNALTERDLGQRAAQAARADETDRLGVAARVTESAADRASREKIADQSYQAALAKLPANQKGTVERAVGLAQKMTDRPTELSAFLANNSALFPGDDPAQVAGEAAAVFKALSKFENATGPVGRVEPNAQGETGMGASETAIWNRPMSLSSVVSMIPGVDDNMYTITLADGTQLQRYRSDLDEADIAALGILQARQKKADRKETTK